MWPFQKSKINYEYNLLMFAIIVYASILFNLMEYQCFNGAACWRCTIIIIIYGYMRDNCLNSIMITDDGIYVCG